MLTVFAAAVLILAACWGLFWLWRRGVEREIDEGAAHEFERLGRQEPDLVAGMDAPALRAAYARVERPRFPAYALAAVTAFVLGTPLVLGVLGGVSGALAGPDYGEAAIRLQIGEGGAARLANEVSTEELQYVLQGWSGFYYFFGLLLFWILVLAVTMRRYHARTPGFLREEVLRSR